MRSEGQPPGEPAAEFAGTEPGPLSPSPGSSEQLALVSLLSPYVHVGIDFPKRPCQ